jgi:hypothetical protein
MAGQRFKKREACAAGECKDHPQRCSALIADVVARGSPGDCPWDGSCPRATGLHPLQSQPRASGGALKRHRPGVDDGREQSLQAVARQLPWAAKTPGRLGQRR